MRVTVVKYAKPAKPEYEKLVDIYIKRLKPHYRVQALCLKDSPKQKSTLKAFYSSLNLDPKKASVRFVCLDERGKSYSTLKFADLFSHFLDAPQVQELVFIVGGPFGISEEILAASHARIRLSDLTLPSDLAWLTLWEQLYRAHTILAGLPYHHA